MHIAMHVNKSEGTFGNIDAFSANWNKVLELTNASEQKNVSIYYTAYSIHSIKVFKRN